MMKQHGNKLMQKWKNKAGVRLSALDKKKLVLTNLPYVLTAFYADRASCLYRRSPGEDIGNKLLYWFLWKSSQKLSERLQEWLVFLSDIEW